MAHLERTSTPGIYRKGNRYVVTWRYRGRQHRQSVRTLAEARELKGQRQAGDRRPRTRSRFEDYFKGWISGYAGRTRRGFSETTRREYERPIEAHALPRWRTWQLDEVEPADVRALFTDLRDRGVSAAGVKKLRAALSVMYATAVEDGLVRSNPVTGVRIPSVSGDQTDSDGRAKALTRAELGILLAALPEGSRLFFEFLAHTGLRISETIGLTWAHVDLGTSPRVQIREQVYRGERKRLKTRHARRDIPLSPGMAERLRTLRRDTYTGEAAPVFPSATGGPLDPRNLRRRTLDKAAKSVGLEWVSFHTFRHTCASLLFEAGKDVKQVQEWLGHHKPSFTVDTYVHLLDNGLGGADFLDAAVRLGGNGGTTQGTETDRNADRPQTAKAAA